MTMKRVMFVDPDAASTERLKKALEHQKAYWNMGFTASGARAFEVMEASGACDVVVAELALQDMDGVEFFKELAERYPETVRISLTDTTDGRILARAASLTHQFLGKPCDPKHLTVLVSRAFAVRDRLRECPLRKRLHDVGGIPSLPVLYQQVMAEIQLPDSSAASVAAIIEKDPGMSAKLLQIVNSAGVGLANEVSNITQAVSLLGLDRMRTLVLAAEMYTLIDTAKLPRGFSAESLWNHSLAVGAYAKNIALVEGVDNKIVDDAFMAGLLHDIGLIVLATGLPDELGEVLQLAKERGLPLFEAEKEIFQATHAEIGGYLLDLWGLPDPVVLAITFHDYPSGVPEENYPSACPEHGFTALTAVHVANYFHEDEEKAAYGYPPMEADAGHLSRLGFTEKMGVWWDACHQTVM